MIIDRTHARWCYFVLIFTGLLALSYLIYVHTSMVPPTGGTILGLIYGILAFLIMAFVSLLGARKKVPAWRIGRATTWLKGHLWLSLLLIPLLLFHSGFKSGGPLTVVIWMIFAIVMASGLLGIILQQMLPRLMTEQVRMETIYDQIDHVLQQVRYETDIQITQLVGPLGVELIVPEGATAAKIKEGIPQPGSEQSKKFYLDRVRPSLDPAVPVDATFNSATKINTFFEEARLVLPPNFHATLDTLRDVMEECRQLERQKTLHHWLHGWLFCHVPLSVLLMVLTLIHIVTALWY